MSGSHGVLIAFSKGLELDLGGDLDVLTDSLAFVGLEVRCVNL